MSASSALAAFLEIKKIWVPFFWKHSTSKNIYFTEDWTSQKTLNKEQKRLCALDKDTERVHIKNLCIHLYIYIKINQSINYLVNKRKCLIITWSPSMHNMCKKKQKTFKCFFLFLLWVRLLKVKSNKILYNRTSREKRNIG